MNFKKKVLKSFVAKQYSFGWEKISFKDGMKHFFPWPSHKWFYINSSGENLNCFMDFPCVHLLQKDITSIIWSLKRPHYLAHHWTNFLGIIVGRIFIGLLPLSSFGLKMSIYNNTIHIKKALNHQLVNHFLSIQKSFKLVKMQS